MRCRVYRNADGSLRVLYPLAPQMDEEPDAVYMGRIAANAERADPTLTACTVVGDVDDSELPARTEADEQGDETDARAAWRWNGARVVVDASVMPPNWARLLNRLWTHIPATVRARHADAFALLIQAVQERDIETLQAIYDRVKAAQSSASPPLTAQQWMRFQETLKAKRMKIAL